MIQQLSNTASSLVVSGAIQKGIIDTEWHLSHYILFPIICGVPFKIGNVLEAIVLPNSKDDYKAYNDGHDQDGKFGLFEFSKQYVKRTVCAPLSFAVNGANQIPFTILRFIFDYLGARAQVGSDSVPGVNEFKYKPAVKKQLFLLLGVPPRSDDFFRYAKENSFYRFEHLFGTVFQYGLFMFLVKMYISPLLRNKLHWYKKFDLLVYKKIQKPFLRFIYWQIVKPLLIEYQGVKRKLLTEN